jgi:uncharacterized lipoprotein YddW (UPF0748 family)
MKTVATAFYVWISALKVSLLLTCSMFFFCANAQPSGQFVVPEMRAVWIATINNIDWPPRSGMTPDQQRASFIQLLNKHQCNGINTIIVQVRPSGDAFYFSAYEPWSQWLTGKQGVAPQPFYDPLQFMIEETHKRGMEFHAWINPLRGVQNIKTSSIADNHLFRLHPEWFVGFGDKRFFDPGNKAVQQHLLLVVKDIVKRYDVDAIHIDDYFYPYPEAGKKFNDQESFIKSGQGMKLDDWRRSNIDSIVCSISKAIKEEKKTCQFGVSPFGVWRHSSVDSTGSKTAAGPTDYDDLYANILLWLKNGWVDYVTPQVYWEIGHRHTPCEVLIDWWSKNTYGRNCYIGIGTYKAGINAAWKDKSQLPRQIQKIRSTPNIKGMMFFSSKSLENNLNGWSDSLQQHYFSIPAPTPKFDFNR